VGGPCGDHAFPAPTTGPAILARGVPAAVPLSSTLALFVSLPSSLSILVALSFFLLFSFSFSLTTIRVISLPLLMRAAHHVDAIDPLSLGMPESKAEYVHV